MDQSQELGQHKGFGFISGQVPPLRDNSFNDVHYKIPHIGWGRLEFSENRDKAGMNILAGVDSGDFVYFLHSYVAVPEKRENIIARTTYGQDTFCSFLNRDNIYGCQFHPEKSGDVGLRILSNFMNLG